MGFSIISFKDILHNLDWNCHEPNTSATKMNGAAFISHIQTIVESLDELWS
jgi:hypothetical protein